MRLRGILLKNTNLFKGKNTLILPRNAYKRGTQYIIKANGNEKLVQIGVLQMKQREWVGVELPD